MRIPSGAVCIFALSLAVGACGNSSEVTTDADDTMTPAAEAPTGTSGMQPAAEVREEPVSEALPDTASPLALIGGLGVLSLAGAAGLRALRRG